MDRLPPHFPLHPVRALVSVIIVGCELGVALADDPKPATAAHPEVRQSVLSEFHFVAKPAAPAASAPVWSTHAFAENPPPAAAAPVADDEIVRLPAMIVHGDRTSQAIDAALKTQAAAAEVRKSYSRFGVGMHELRLGKLKLYLLTELGIPVMVSIPF